MIDTYFWKIKYWNDFISNDEDYITCCGTIGATSYSDATAKIEDRFSDCTIEEIQLNKAIACDGFVFFDEEQSIWEKLLSTHTEI